MTPARCRALSFGCSIEKRGAYLACIAFTSRQWPALRSIGGWFSAGSRGNPQVAPTTTKETQAMLGATSGRRAVDLFVLALVVGLIVVAVVGLEAELWSLIP